MRTAPRKTPETGLYGPVRRELNELRDYVRETAVHGGRGIKVDRRANGTLLSLDTIRTDQVKVRLLRLKEILPDHLRCVPWGGTSLTADDGTQIIYVLRDPELMRTRFDGLTIAYSSDGDSFSASYTYTSNTKRTKTISGTAETQVITPYYKLDFTIIKAIESDEPIPSVTPSGGSLTSVTHVELTQRAWTKQ